MFQSLRKMWAYTAIILLLSFTISFTMPKHAKASTLYPNEGQGALLMALLALEGLVVMANTSTQAVIQSAWTKMSDTSKNSILQYDSAGQYTIPKSVWDDLKGITPNLDGVQTLTITGSGGSLVPGTSVYVDAPYGGLDIECDFGDNNPSVNVYFTNNDEVGLYQTKTWFTTPNNHYEWRMRLTTKVNGVTTNYYTDYTPDYNTLDKSLYIEISPEGQCNAFNTQVGSANFELGVMPDYYNRILLAGSTGYGGTYQFTTWEDLEILYGIDMTVDPDYADDPAWDMGGVTLKNLSTNPADYKEASPPDIVAGAVDSSVPVPVPETDGTEVGLLGGILQYLAQIRNLIANQNPATTPDPAINDQVPALGETFAEKTGYSVFEDTWAALQNMNTSQGNAPQIKLNLHQLIDKSVGTIHASAAASNPFTDEEKVIFDFADFEEYSWGGFNLIQIFRILVGFSMVYSTIMMAWRRIIPDKVIS